ncbi:hypothetical protein KKG36_02030 [Patescibacteria group bacterium]|nr:hypothetical protein [Patescibacteria group bacterium]
MNEEKNVYRFVAAVLMGLPEVGGEQRQRWIDHPRELQEALSVLNRMPDLGLRTWKTIKLGGLKNADDFRRAIKGCGMRINDGADDIIGTPGFVVAAGEVEVDLVKVTVGDLGFTNGATRGQIYVLAEELGLKLCPPEVGPQLRLQHKDQPNGEWIIIGMEPIRDSDGNLHVFDVGRGDSGQWLGSDYGNPDNFWSAGNQWLFVRPRKCQ